jgi:hypothetical protein
MAASESVRLFDVQQGPALLLDVPVRFHDLFRLHGRKLLGNDL